MWVAVKELPRSVSHPFYEKLNRCWPSMVRRLRETQCRPFYAEKMDAPVCTGHIFVCCCLATSKPDSERGCLACGARWSACVSRLALTEAAPDHSLSRHGVDRLTPIGGVHVVLQCLASPADQGTLR